MRNSTAIQLALLVSMVTAQISGFDSRIIFEFVGGSMHRDATVFQTIAKSRPLPCPRCNIFLPLESAPPPLPLD